VYIIYTASQKAKKKQNNKNFVVCRVSGFFCSWFEKGILPGISCTSITPDAMSKGEDAVFDWSNMFGSGEESICFFC
jgi:hypothetical protein